MRVFHLTSQTRLAVGDPNEEAILKVTRQKGAVSQVFDRLPLGVQYSLYALDDVIAMGQEELQKFDMCLKRHRFANHNAPHQLTTDASQINGCAYCLDMHSKDARANGETEQRLYGLDAWRETPYYSERERAALEWTEALTLVSETRVPDEVYERVRKQFSEDELAHLSLAVVAINGWNRLNIAARTVPGDYVAGSLAKMHAAS
jgi:AhpD family alkylhydroperoxidase